jgi:carbon starvation protein
MSLRVSRRLVRIGGSVAVACILGGCAYNRGEGVNAAWLLLASVCVYVIGWRWYSAFIAARVLGLDDARATPAEIHDDGKDYVPTHKWVVYGHHFAAIAGPGPLIGPILAAQLGYLPGLIWIVVGGVLAGCVQDFVILFCSLRRDGRSLGQMARDELGAIAGFAAMFGILTIMVILLAVIALVVVRALAHSPWGAWTIACTIPIAMLMGVYMRWWRPGKVEEASLIGVVLVIVAVISGGWVAHDPTLAAWFTLSAKTLAVIMIAYGFAASTLPVWMLLAPRDYLSTFVKVGTIGALALGLLIVRPLMEIPAITEFASTGLGPVWAGNLFPFCFITIACGAISGFHALISSGTTPKLLAKETQARLVGYGGMLTESFVALMALLAACSLTPGVYFAVNAPPTVVGKTPAAVVSTISGWGFPVSETEMSDMAREVGEETLYARVGGAPTLALGMARIFGRITGGRWMDLWYHFAIMFEALFILTTLDAGTRVGRFMLQDMLGHVWAPLKRVSWGPGVIFTSLLMVGAWGWFLWGGVTDPNGGINSLWPLFGIANQMLASIALCVATAILIKMGRGALALVAGLPLLWLLVTTQTATFEKVWSPSPRIGFLTQARAFDAQAEAETDPTEVARARQLAFNARLNAGMAILFAVLAWIVLLDGARVCWLNRKRGLFPLQEAPWQASRLTT